MVILMTTRFIRIISDTHSLFHYNENKVYKTLIAYLTIRKFKIPTCSCWSKISLMEALFKRLNTKHIVVSRDYYELNWKLTLSDNLL